MTKGQTICIVEAMKLLNVSLQLVCLVYGGCGGGGWRARRAPGWRQLTCMVAATGPCAPGPLSHRRPAPFRA